MRVCVFAEKAHFYNSICISYTFCVDSLESCSQRYKHKFNYNDLFFSNDLFNNRMKINGCVEKYYGEMVA